MLTTEEIKKALDTGDAVGLECVDVDMYCRTDSAFKHEREVISRSSLVITSIIGQGDFKALMISDCRYCIPENDLKHFRIKRPAPTFDDLIDIAVKAKKDGLLTRVEIRELSLNATSKDIEFCTSINAGSIVIQKRIDYIKSLYTETFVIEGFHDTKALKKGDKAVLGNGEEVIFSNRTGVNGALWFEYNDCHRAIIPFIALKGATVTQKRGAL